MRSSAAGSTFSKYYGVNGNIGRAIMIIASLATVLLGLNKLVQIIGYISPVLLLEQGYEVHITYRRSAGKAEELMAANPGRLFAHKLDQGKIEEIENADFLVENEWYGVIFNAALGSGTVKEYADQGDPLNAASDVVLTKDNVATCAGCTVALETLATLLAEPGDVFLIPAPYYSSFVDDINERAGVIAVDVPCDETLDRNAFEAAYERVTAEGRRVRAVLCLLPYPVPAEGVAAVPGAGGRYGSVPPTAQDRLRDHDQGPCGHRRAHHEGTGRHLHHGRLLRLHGQAGVCRGACAVAEDLQRPDDQRVPRSAVRL